MPNSSDSENGTSIKGVEKSFRIIESLVELRNPSLTNISSHLGIPKSTVHVHLQTLEKIGYVVNQEGEYRVGLRFLELGEHARSHYSVYQTAQNELVDLANKTDEAVNIGVIENGERVLIKKLEMSDAVYDNAMTGERTHLHWTALGKAILAELEDNQIRSIVEQHGLPRATENTITDLDELLEECAQTHSRGYSIEDEERREGILAVGVPILDRSTDEVLGSICVSGPKKRLVSSGDIDESIISAVQSSANVIELRCNHY
ncbi:IclR family transcriptional regulator [Natranaeroarchaeum sulfidigenes]|uniref:DNA-binding transcriptional regulator, IclR family n=1 Tax=Natranaeroarchaeum sulfidigenes TaxID=2784880 RepID=A0A897MSW6_9EURY|nr:IclR family transcriptional regulator [Natranaeroarchaeum sulfidigenes]QSG03391.1 DNA-binding transcriptional regulator, IclR family [Natranaeroarchaeum sulfidigenes]